MVNNVDIIVGTGNANVYGGAKTSADISAHTGDILGAGILTILDPSTDVASHTLAHEFGHGVAIASDPIEYLEAAKLEGTSKHNCQAAENRFHILSRVALDWQDRYDTLKHRRR
ncbi:MAG: hypothetical protein EOP48_07760 [Sphingobacteriales bacterium]|nr:MAG: hypothetical protein EOP48_07760 [Sphingobacteriales bacterium]